MDGRLGDAELAVALCPQMAAADSLVLKAQPPPVVGETHFPQACAACLGCLASGMEGAVMHPAVIPPADLGWHLIFLSLLPRSVHPEGRGLCQMARRAGSWGSVLGHTAVLHRIDGPDSPRSLGSQKDKRVEAGHGHKHPSPWQGWNRVQLWFETSFHGRWVRGEIFIIYLFYIFMISLIS